MTTTAGDALSHVVLAMILEGAICGDRRRREPARDPQCDRPAGPPGPVLAPSPMHGPMSEAQGGSSPRTNQLNFRITCANLVAADENYIRRYFYLIAKLKFS
jgi:hypothetical protein